MSFYDGPIDPPEYEFGTCINCGGSEEDHVTFYLDEGFRRPVEYNVCPSVIDVAEAVEEDYPNELVFRGTTGNNLVIAYEDALNEILDNLYDERE
jgi:hypothetical protein